jgi:hypothetical protein
MFSATVRGGRERPRWSTGTRWARRLRLGAMAGLVLVLAATAAAADARQVFRETIHEERDIVLEDFCEVPGLTVELSRVMDMRVNVVSRGQAGLTYFLQHGVTKEVLHNPATGKSLTSVATVTEKDMRVTENGDGTLTILVLATGNAVLYGPNGKAIARNPGQTRFEILVDDGGTPNDPSDDEFLGRLGTVKESTGRNDDFCEAAVPALN